MAIAKITEDQAESVLPALKAWMSDAGLTHEDVAEMAGCSRSEITRTLQGKRALNTDRAMKLAAVSGIPVERLVTDRDTLRILKLLGNRQKRSSRKARQ
jgi:antitoxin component HigA of HigAB toxin-antitoxin module